MIRFLGRPKGMSCVEVAQLLQHYLDRQLDDGVFRRVSVHLDDCRHCEIEYTVYRDIKDALAGRGCQPLDPAVLSTLQRFCDELTRHSPPPADQ